MGFQATVIGIPAQTSDFGFQLAPKAQYGPVWIIEVIPSIGGAHSGLHRTALLRDNRGRSFGNINSVHFTISERIFEIHAREFVQLEARAKRSANLLAFV